MIKVIGYNFHGRFFNFFKKIPNVELTLVDKNKLVDLSDQFDYAIVADFSLLHYQKIKCKKILIDIFPPSRLTNLQKYAYFDNNTSFIVFATYKQLIECNLKLNSKVKVFNWAVDINAIDPWIGGINKVLGVCNMISRPACGESIWTDVTNGLPKTLVGFGNDHLSENVGVKNDEELYNMYKNYNVFFHHTTTSVAPNVLLEAMAAGIPIVSYDSWFANEHLTFRGFISNNICELKSELKKLLDNPYIYKEYSEINRSYIKSNFSPELFYYRWTQILKL